MPTIVIKPDRDVDFYIGWSTVTENPHWWGPRSEVTAYLAERASAYHDDQPEVRLARADRYGTSDMSVREGEWGDDGLIYEQRGILPRRHLVAACEALGRADEAAVWALLEPFEDHDAGDNSPKLSGGESA
jgi:hypothetical protein